MGEEMVFTNFTCGSMGVALTSHIFVRRSDSWFVARAGVAILGHTNKDWPMDKSPFDEGYQDNYVEGRGHTVNEAIKAMDSEIRKISEGLLS